MKPLPENKSKVPGVYVSLEQLVKIQYKARGFSFLPRQPVYSLLTGRYASRLRGRGLNFEEIRRYLPGDDIRNMDWKVTARTRKPYTRVYTEERDRPAILVVDQRCSMFFGSRVNMKSVTAAELAALTAWRVFSVGDRIGAVVFNDTGMTEIRPHRSRKRVMHILQVIVEQNQALRVDSDIPSSPDMLNQALERTANLVKHDYAVFVISDFFGLNSDTQRLIKLMSRHNDVMLAMIHDPIAAEMPEAGEIVISDGTRQIVLDSNSAKIREKIPEVFRGRLGALSEELFKYGVPVLPIHTAEDPAGQVRRILGHAPGRQPRPRGVFSKGLLGKG